MRSALRLAWRWPTLAGLLTLALLIPVWSVRYPPLQDYPNHLARAYISLHLNDPGSPFARYYTLDLAPVPNALSDLALLALGSALPMETAGKVLLSINLAALPWAVIAFLRATGRPDWRTLGLFGWVFAYSHFTDRGYLNYCLGLWLLLLALACIVRFDRSSAGPTAGRWGWGALAALLIALTYLAHLFALIALTVALVVIALAGKRDWRRLARLASLWAPTAGLSLLYLSTLRTGNGFVWTWYPSLTEYGRVLVQSFMAYDTRRELLSYAPAILLWGGLAAWGVYRAPAGRRLALDKDTATATGLYPASHWLGASFAVLLCSAVTPLTISAVGGQKVDLLIRLGQRFVLPGLFLALAGLPTLRGRPRRGAQIVLIASATAVIAGTGLTYHRYQPSLTAIAGSLQQLEPGLALGHWTDLPYTCNTNPYRHFADYVVIWRNAPVAGLFTDYSLLRQRIPMPSTLDDGLTAATLPADSRFYPQFAILSKDPPPAVVQWYERVGGAGNCSLWRSRVH